MSAPGPTMKTIQKRFYTVLPRAVSSPSSPPSSSISRVRSGSLSTPRTLYTANPSSGPLSFFDSPPPPPPPPSSRPGNPHVLSTSRLPIKPEGEGNTHSSGHHPQNSPHAHNQASGPPPFSLALTSPQSNSSSHHVPASYQSPGFFPYPSFSPIPFYNVSLAEHPESHPRTKRQRTRYHFDVGACGIPKRSKGHVVAGKDGYNSTNLKNGRLFQDKQSEDLSLAVQVGEDAYFIRGNAMGVADGVGGWSRMKHGDVSPSRNCCAEPSPSALFARRLMHYCSAETEAACSSVPVSPTASQTSSIKTPQSARFLSGGAFFNNSWPWSTDVNEVSEELENSLEELEEGLDVLMILERAYESTIKAHVVHESTRNPSDTPDSVVNAEIQADEPSHSRSSSFRPSLTTVPEHQPVSSSGSLHLVPDSGSSISSQHSSEHIPLMTGSSTALLVVLEHSSHQPTKSSTVRATLFQDDAKDVAFTSKDGAVIKIAHLGDCMGMLVRGEEIVWRSEEMWWGFNTPVQLGPSSSARPKDAQIFTLPVEGDDILILASDGLSDNLWDEEVLDEVVRFKRSFLKIQDPSLKSEIGDSMSSGLLGRRTLAGMLSEALCSRARHVSERRGQSPGKGTSEDEIDEEVPFARRAREQGRSFRGGKIDDISVLVAVISPADATPN